MIGGDGQDATGGAGGDDFSSSTPGGGGAGGAATTDGSNGASGQGGGGSDQGNCLLEYLGGNGGDGGYGGGGGGGGGWQNKLAEGSGGTGVGGNGNFGGGGGGGAGRWVADSYSRGGDGGFGGGGGAGGGQIPAGPPAGYGGQGGFGADDGGGGTSPGTSVYGGGSGGTLSGGGGAALGGAIFIQDGGTCEIQNGVSFSGSALTAGTGANSGSTSGTDIFLMSGGTLNFNNTDTITIATSITSDSGAGGGSGGGITKSNSGTVVFQAANTYTGGTSITGGTIQIHNNTSLTSADVTMSGGTISFGTGSLVVANDITLGAGGGTINSNGNDGELSGVISSSGALTKTGSGTLTLSGINTYVGTTTISAGTLALSGSGALSGTSPVDVDTSGAIFDISATTSGTTIASLAGVSGASVVLGSKTLTVGNSSSTAFSGVISGASGAVTKNGSGTLTYSGASANTYTGLTTVSAGGLSLNKSAGTAAIAGNVTIDGGTLSMSAANQFDSAATTVTLSSGEFDMDGNAQEIYSFIFQGGTFTAGSAFMLGPEELGAPPELKIKKNGSNALQMRNTTLDGNVTLDGGDSQEVSFDDTNNGTATISGTLSMGNNKTTFSLPKGLAENDMAIDAIISSGALDKANSGVMALLGSSSNTYTGDTTITSGTIKMGKTGGAKAIQGDVIINGGPLEATAANQLATTTTVTLSSGTFDMGGYDQEMQSLIFQGGTFTPGTGELTLSGDDTALTMRNTTISGDLKITGDTPSVVFDSTNNGTATISGDIDFDGSSPTFTVNSGSSDNDMLISGNITNGGSLTKASGGTLNLSGESTFTGGVTIQGGTLAVSNTLTTPSITIDSGGALSVSGNGSFSGDLSVSGTMSIGNSIGNISVGGNYTQEANSTFEFEVTPTTSDYLEVASNININQSNTTFTIIPEAGVYPSNKEYTAIKSTGGVRTGTFTNFSISPLLFSGRLAYSVNEVRVVINVEALDQAITTGNAGRIAHLFNYDVLPPDNDFEEILEEIVFLDTIEEIADALDQLQPSALKSMPSAQQSVTLLIGKTMTNHQKSLISNTESIKSENIYSYLSCCNEDNYIADNMWGNLMRWNNQNQKKCKIWTVPMFSHIRQGRIKDSVGYSCDIMGNILGIDHKIGNYGLLGVAAGYTRTNITMKNSRGSGHINSYYLIPYVSYFRKAFFFDAMFNGYYAKNKNKGVVRFSNIVRNAYSRPDGYGVQTHIDSGFIFKPYKFIVKPFGSFDSVYQHQEGFTEKGGNGANMVVRSSNYLLISTEFGLGFGTSFKSTDYNVEMKPYVDFSYSYEKLVEGRKYNTNFVDQAGVATVYGINQRNSYFNAGAEIAFIFKDPSIFFSLGYNGKFTKSYLNNMAIFSLGYSY